MKFLNVKDGPKQRKQLTYHHPAKHRQGKSILPSLRVWDLTMFSTSEPIIIEQMSETLKPASAILGIRCVNVRGSVTAAAQHFKVRFNYHCSGTAKWTKASTLRNSLPGCRVRFPAVHWFVIIILMHNFNFKKLSKNEPASSWDLFLGRRQLWATIYRKKEKYAKEKMTYCTF